VSHGSLSGSTPTRPSTWPNFLDRDECAQRGQQVQPQQAQLPQVSIQQMPIQQVPLQSGPLQSGSLQQVKLTESAPEGTGERLTLPRSPCPDPGLAWIRNPLESGFTATS